MKRRAWVETSLIAATAAAYLVAAKFGLSVTFVAEQVTLVWAPTGIALAAVVLVGPRAWIGVALGAFLANVTAHENVGTAVGIAAGNTAEAVVGVAALRRVCAFDPSLRRVRDVAAFVVVAAVGATAISATVGAVSLCVGGVQDWRSFDAIWREWWVGDAIGAVVVAPFLLTWAGTRWTRPTAERAVEAGALFAVLVAVHLVAYGGPHAGARSYPVDYVAFPFLIWAAMRFGPRGASAVGLAVAVIAVRATLRGTGPFRTGDQHEELALLQLFLGVTSVTGLFLGAAIGERDRAESAARESDARSRRLVENLEELDRRKDEFLATLAHELRNPLAPLANALRLLRAGPRGDAAFRDALGVAERQTADLARLVDDLLDVSRATRGELTLRVERTTLADVVRRAVETSRAAVEAGGRRFTIALPAASVPLDVDPLRIAQVISNLLNNAAKFGAPGGAVSLVGEVMKSDAGGRGHAVISVADDGMGVEPEALARIFEPFVRTERARERARGGLGIGLALVKRIVETHGGSVEARSDGPGRGSVFTVRLPVPDDVAPVRAEPAGPTSRAARTPRGSRRRVLVVDDNRDSARTTSALLENLGYETATAFDGPEAVAAAAAFRAHAALVDLGLPAMNGFDVARAIRALPDGASVLLIAVTGWGRADDRRRTREAGFDHHLVKPVDHELLDRLLADAPAETPGAAADDERAAADAGRARRVDDEFLAQASHDLRTPLNTLYAASQILEDSELDADQRSAVDSLRAACTDLRAVLDGLLGVEPHASSSGAPESFHGLRVTVVDDDASGRALAVSLLRSLGCEVDEASDARGALKILADSPHDAAVVDGRMPDVSGVELARGIRRTDAPGRRLRLVAATASTAPQDHRALLEAGVDAVLVKPLSADALRAALDGRSGTASCGPAPDVELLDEAVLDHVRGLTTRDGRPVADRLVDLAERDVPDQLNALREAAARGDGASFESAAHRLRGICASVGARRIASLAADAERLVRTDGLAAARDIVPSVESAWSETLAALRRRRN